MRHIIYDAQWHTVWLWQFWSFGRFLKGKNMAWMIFLVILLYKWRTLCIIVHHLWCTVHHQWRTVRHCAINMLAVLYRGRLQSSFLSIVTFFFRSGAPTALPAWGQGQHQLHVQQELSLAPAHVVPQQKEGQDLVGLESHKWICFLPEFCIRLWYLIIFYLKFRWSCNTLPSFKHSNVYKCMDM